MTGHELDLALRAVEAVNRVLPGAEVAAQAVRQELALTRFANSVIHQNVAQDATTVRVRVHHDGRTTSGSAVVVDAPGLTTLVERVAAGVRLAPVDGGWPGLAAPAAPAVAAALDPATAAATPGDRAAVVRAFVDGAGGLETAGYCRTLHSTGAFASTGGQEATTESVECGLAGIARDRGADGVARSAAQSIADLSGDLLGARAAAKARAWADPRELPQGRYEVVLEPGAVADVLGNLAGAAFSGKAVGEQRSFLRLGEDQFDPAVTLVDDPLAVGLSVDDEGTARRRLVLVDAGRTTAVAHDLRTAREYAATSTGHHLEAAGSAGPSPRHLGMFPSGDPSEAAGEVEGPMADSSVVELVAGVRRGVLVTDFWYTRILDSRSLSITGLTRNGVWLIEDGVVTAPLRNFRFTQSYAQALAPGNVRAVGRTTTPVPGDTYTASSPRWSCPALHLASWNFTGGASG